MDGRPVLRNLPVLFQIARIVQFGFRAFCHGDRAREVVQGFLGLGRCLDGRGCEQWRRNR
jgi:hypothetical protein